MKEYLIWIFSYISLVVGIFWLHILLYSKKEERELIRFPSITIAIPAYNEADSVSKTIESVLESNYPKDKLKVIVVDDGSKDNTAEIVKRYKKAMLIRQGNAGKATALNNALSHTNTELFACLDSDSTISRDSIAEIVANFDSNTGAVVSTIKIHKPETFIQKLQWFEYLFVALMRSLMSSINTIFVTPGVLSVYKTEVIKKIGGFSEGNLTEDLEMALKLHSNHHNIKMESNSITYTQGQRTFMELWRQRVRWFRGFIYNIINYRFLLFNKKYGMVGTFQLPLAIIAILGSFIFFPIIIYEVISKIYLFLVNLYLIGFDLFRIINIPPLKQLLLGLNYKILFPVLIVLLITVFFFYLAHKTSKEKLRYPLTFPIFILYFPLINTLHWIAALVKEATGAKKRW